MSETEKATKRTGHKRQSQEVLVEWNRKINQKSQSHNRDERME